MSRVGIGSLWMAVAAGGIALFGASGTAEAQCSGAYPVLCAAFDACFESGVVCSTVRRCSSGLVGCRSPGLEVDCSTGSCFDPDDGGGGSGCTSPDYPVSCLGSDSCWSSGTVCSTLRVCDGDEYACTSSTSRPDCSDGGRCAPTGGGGTGGMCTNTCRYANDGECDDGGPGSLYSVCDYGTDCGDCGSRSGGGDGGCSAAAGPSSMSGLYGVAAGIFVAFSRRRRRRQRR